MGGRLRQTKTEIGMDWDSKSQQVKRFPPCIETTEIKELLFYLRKKKRRKEMFVIPEEEKKKVTFLKSIKRGTEGGEGGREERREKIHSE